MQPFIARLARRHGPTVSFTASLDCDAVVRTTTAVTTARELLADALRGAISDDEKSQNVHSGCIPVILVSPDETPPLGLHATRALEDALRAPGDIDTVVKSFAEVLENVTAVAPHTHFREPVLALCAAWVGESSFEPPSNDSIPTYILLFVRDASRHDDAALSQALPRAFTAFGEDFVHVVRLPAPDAKIETDDDVYANKRVNAIATRIVTLARSAASLRTDKVAAASERARRAARPLFRTWFSGAPAQPPPLLPPDGGTPSSPSRRSSFSLALRTPLFDPACAEGLARRYADFAFVVGRYSDAADAYGQLAADCRALTGMGSIHEAAALEMTAMSRAILTAPLAAITPSLNRAIAAYARAARPELAVRAALRASQFCLDSNANEGAASFLLRARDAIAPVVAPSAAPTGSAFVDSALAILAAASSSAASRLRKHRRASLYAFVSMTRFLALRNTKLAAQLSDIIDPGALSRLSIAHHVSLVRGVAAAEDGRFSSAVSHFASILSSTSDATDVELQSVTVRAFLSTVANDAADALPNRWDGGVSFPLLPISDVRVTTQDMGNEDQTWRTLEDDVLEDMSYFHALQSSNDNTLPKRERRIENVIADLRRREGRRGSTSVGGSLEMKIRRLREVATQRRKILRGKSLLDRGAVIGEHICLQAMLMNPLQFPLFVDNVCAVVSLNGCIYSSGDDRPVDVDNDNDENHTGIEFFPVDGVSLAPCSSQRISVRIIAHNTGTLRFIGMTWRFTIGMGSASPKASSPVPGFCVLQRRGHRLNKTRKQRASDPPIYEEDTSLCVKVVAKAPRLSARLLHRIEDDSRLDTSAVNDVPLMRAGEIRKSRLVIENEGDADVQDVVLRIGSPDSMFVDVAPCKVAKGTDTVLCALSLKDATALPSGAFVSAVARIDVASKSQVEIPVWLRGTVPNSAFSNTPKARKTRLKDRLVDSAGAIENGIMSCSSRLILAYGDEHARVCRVEATMKVRCSITASPRFMRETDARALFGEKGANLCGVLLGIEIEHAGRLATDNLRFDVTEVEVTTCGRWRPMLLPSPDKPKDKPNNEVMPSQTSLLMNETATVFTLIVREQNMGKSQSSLQNVEEEGEMEDDYSNDERQWQSAFVRFGAKSSNESTERDKSEARASSHFVLCARNTLNETGPARGNWAHVAIRWRASAGVRGDMHIPPLDPLRWMSRKYAGESNSRLSVAGRGGVASVGRDDSGLLSDVFVRIGGDPVQVSVSHVLEVEHDFLEDPLSGNVSKRISSAMDRRSVVVFPAIIDVAVTLRNVSSLLVDVLFSAPPVGGVADGDRGRHWGGDVAVSMRSLVPGAERILRLTAIITTPGTFDVARFSVVVQCAGFQAARARRVIKVPPSFVTVRATRPLPGPVLSTMQLAGMGRASGGAGAGHIATVAKGKRDDSKDEKHALSYVNDEEKKIVNEVSSKEKIEVKHINEVQGVQAPKVALLTTANGDASQTSNTDSNAEKHTVVPPEVSPAGRRRSISTPSKLLEQSADDVAWDDADTDDEA